MCKVISVIFLMIVCHNSSSQKSYDCQFADTIAAVLNDSALRQLSQFSDPADLELPQELREQLFSKMKESFLGMYQLRGVKASKDRTLISIDRNSKSGVLRMETFDSLLYINDDLFVHMAAGFSQKPLSTPKKEFTGTGRQRVILKYKCDEYISTDSTCLIWITRELPDYINPGIRKGNIAGAVIGFQLTVGPTITKSILTRLKEL